MVQWWWLIVSFIIGGIIGWFLFAAFRIGIEADSQRQNLLEFYNEDTKKE